jgi:hypothetical protein
VNELPDWMVEPLRLVLGDMGVAPRRLRFDGEYVRLQAGGERIAVWTGEQDRGEDLLVLLAERLQDEIAETRDLWGEARPECPGHTHPCSPELIDGSAWWVCPRDGRRVARIGSLGAPANGGR